MSLLPGIWGQDAACLATVLAAINPFVGGVLLAGPPGTAKSTIARTLAHLLPAGTGFHTLPLSATEETLLGGVDLERTLGEGRRVRQAGLLERVRGEALFVDDLQLLPRELAWLLAGHEETLLVATANPNDGELSPHLLDRFGLAVAMADLREPDQRLKVLHSVLDRSDPSSLVALARRVAKAREQLVALPLLSDAVRERIQALVEEASCSSHRCDLFLAQAARALAAWAGAPAVTPKHVEIVAPLVLDHRRTERSEPPPPPQGDEGASGESEVESREGSPPPESAEGSDRQVSSEMEDRDRDEEQSAESSAKEEVMAVGETFPVRRLNLPKDRLRRRNSGRRTKTQSKGPDGRTIRTVPQGEANEIHLFASLRAAAPFQPLRGRID
ncbi:MAG: AAA domain-containing protein, partial [Phyllobacteriaceae bacterium]|nr:AAA domain-containing protein [Phyllobacteriaceae bacterium]